MDDIVTPVNVEKLGEMLRDSCYDPVETEFLVKEFSEGFDIGYEGPQIRQDTSQHILFQVGVGGTSGDVEQNYEGDQGQVICGTF